MANLVEWSDDLSVGVQELDEQHKILVGLLNELNTAIEEHHGSTETARILDSLAEYTRVHFAVEESLMRVLEYPDYEHHKAQHEELIEQLTTMRQRLDEGSHGVTFELLHFLKVWLTKHILETDKHYGPHFLERGIKPQFKNTSWVKRMWHSVASG